ncbi:MAG: PepSY domain-containing protein [Bacteroidota bacterium]
MKAFQFLHRWLGILAAVFILLFALSGIVLNHRSSFSAIAINRQWLPKTNQYHNWNLAAVKSATGIGNDSLLVYGNVGIWLTDSTMTGFTPFYQGIRRGADNRRTASIVKTPSGSILAGTMSGLYVLKNKNWHPLPLPVKEKRITGITARGEDIWVTTRSNLLLLQEERGDFSTLEVPLPQPSDFKRETSLFRALWVIHSGKILGLPGKLLVDLMGVVMIFLSLTGIIWFVAPDMMKALRKRITARKRMVRVNRFSLKWHNKLGIWTLAFLIILTITGMFLRPPLLIAIVRSTFPAVKFTILDHPNPWYDKLRDIKHDRLSGGFILSTSQGFYFAEPTFSDSLVPLPYQPPISVMGINVFEQPADGVFITGSFSGIHRWVPAAMHINDFITGAPVTPTRGMANPFGSIPVAGYINLGEKGEFLFDYNAGIVSLTREITAPEMPQEVIKNSPMPLWNLALEVHTGRFYSFVLGKYYILFIPLAGLVILIILVSGGFLWWKDYRRKKKRAASGLLVRD